MAVLEKNGLLSFKDENGNTVLLYPITSLDCVDGAENLLKFSEAQTLSTAEQTQARSNIGAAAASTLTSHTGNKSNPHGVTKAQVGLGNADNTSDANKPISTATQAALDAKAAANHTHTPASIGAAAADHTHTSITTAEIDEIMADIV